MFFPLFITSQIAFQPSLFWQLVFFMTRPDDQLRQLATQLAAGELSWSQFLAAAAPLHAASSQEATLDLDRARRCGYPEVVYGSGKTAGTLLDISRQLADAGQPVLITRVAEDKAAHLSAQIPAGEYNAVAQTWRWEEDRRLPRAGRVGLIAAGTSDLPVSEEARETLDWMGVDVVALIDVGVAGPHRLPARLSELMDCDAIVVVAGMEGALPSVVGGYVDCPVIAAPTSVGFGAAFGGLAALLGMLNSCAANVTVVNIDAGFKAGYVAGMIAQRCARAAD